jgi:hypothetical protein
MFCIKTYVFVVSDNIRPVSLPPQDFNTYEGVTAIVSGFGLTSQGKCVDPFNSYGTDKELLLYSQCHMDLVEVTQDYLICNPTVTLFKCNSCMNLLLSLHVKGCQSRYNILVSKAQERLWGVLVIKFKITRFEVLTAVLLISQFVWNICCVDC